MLSPSSGYDLFIQYLLDNRPIHAGLAKFSPPFGNFGFLQFDNLIWRLADVSENLHLPSGAALEVTSRRCCGPNSHLRGYDPGEMWREPGSGMAWVV